MNEPLSYFVRYKNTVDETETTHAISTFNTELTNIINILTKLEVDKDTTELLITQQQKILEDIETFSNTLDTFKSNVEKILRAEESSYMVESYKIYENGQDQDNSTYILDRSLFHALIYRDEIKDAFLQSIRTNSNWQHPGLFIRPEHGEYINEMTASDPLYVMDETKELLEPVKRMWNAKYQSRVRYDLIDENRDTMFRNCPKGQLGFVVAMNFLNHKPLEIIKRYLMEIHTLLRPGGVFIFTYNNCDFPIAVKNFEKSLYSYTPGRLLKSMVTMLGYEINQVYDEKSTNVSWLELKKPGTLSTLRGGQCLGQIINSSQK